MADDPLRTPGAASDGSPATPSAAQTPAPRPPERDELHVDWRL